MPGVLVITGAGRGIGAATARLAGRSGYAVCVNYVDNRDAAERVVAEIRAGGSRAVAVQADTTKPMGVFQLFERAEQALGPVTALVNNAGITGPIGRFEHLSLETLRRVIDVNVVGYMICAQEAVRRFSTARGGKGGVIVNVSSAAATLGSPGEYVHYAASKAAVDTFTLGLAREVAGEGIRVNAVAPGTIETDIHASAGQPDRPAKVASKIPMARAGQPEEIATAILWLLSDASSYTTGAILRVAGGL